MNKTLIGKEIALCAANKNVILPKWKSRPHHGIKSLLFRSYYIIIFSRIFRYCYIFITSKTFQNLRITMHIWLPHCLKTFVIEYSTK